MNGNSESVINMLADDLKDHEVVVYKMRETKNNFCMACGACQGKDTQSCVQKDDYTNLLPVIDKCDSIVIATPIYNQQVCSMAKLFIERWYPFFKRDAPLKTKALLFPQIPEKGDVLKNGEYVGKIHELAAAWNTLPNRLSAEGRRSA